MKSIRLSALQEGECHDLTQARGATLAEAAAVCLNHHQHADPVTLHLKAIECECEPDPSVRLSSLAVSEKMRNTYNDLPETTEQGAYGIAILLMHEFMGYRVVQQSRKGTGFDYWVRQEEPPSENIFGGGARLEVSGILEDSSKRFSNTVKKKLNQMWPSDNGGLPGFAVVVGYDRPEARIAHRKAVKTTATPPPPGTGSTKSSAGTEQ